MTDSPKTHSEIRSETRLGPDFKADSGTGSGTANGSITPVILCGGAGTRLWPLSRRAFPKQFAPLIGEGNLFQQAATRMSGPGWDAPVIVTAHAFRFIAAQHLAEIGCAPAALLLEPEARDTAPALLAAALHIARDRPEALILAAPADHRIADDAAFQATIATARPLAEAGHIVTIGIPPDRPETGYGYLRLGEAPHTVAAFVEKPDAARAAQMLSHGGYLWNAGLFLMRAQTLIAAFETHAPHILPPVRAALAGAAPDLDFLRLAPAPWAEVEATSIDYAVMEKAKGLRVVPHGGDWSDLGGWDAVARAAPADADGVVHTGPVTAMDCTDSLLRAEAPGQRLVGLGLRDVVAVAMPDAVLVADRARLGDLGDVVGALRVAGAPQADAFPRSHRPWGWFETLHRGPGVHVKRIHVDPGGVLSLQSHRHRAEHWVVVQGTARVTIADRTHRLEANQSIYVPQNARHRLENAGDAPMELIEVQTGAYLEEDDITRHEDVYARGPDD